MIAKVRFVSLEFYVMRPILWLLLLAALTTVARTQAQGIDDQYIAIYSVIQEADTLNNNLQTTQALGKYLEAQTALKKFQRVNPEWNQKVVAFRLTYLAAKVASLSAATPAPKTA